MLEHLDDDNVQLIDLRGEEDFEAAHIPGAARLSSGSAFQAEDENGVKGQLPPAQHVADALGSVGVTNDTVVIFYDGFSGLVAARGLWVLDVYGHADSRILDGGWKLWAARSLETESGAADVAAATYDVPTTKNESLIADRQWVQDAIDDSARQVLDARSPEEYAGRDVRAARGGHVPNAINVNWVMAAQDSGEFKSASELRALYEAAGIDGDKAIATYCQSGVRAAHSWFVLTQLLGFDDVRNYDGSWNEWGNSEDTPIDS